MNLLGIRLRQRRRQLRLLQREVAGSDSASFLSKVENGAAYPSLKSLQNWAERLNTTSEELLGGLLLWEAAKHTVLLTEKCLGYLEYLPGSDRTTFLRKLAASAGSLSCPVPEPPQDPELQYLTAVVLLKRRQIPQAKSTVLKALAFTISPFRQILLLSLLCRIYQALNKTKERQNTEEKLRLALKTLNYQELLERLPPANSVTYADLALLKFSALHSCLNP